MRGPAPGCRSALSPSRRTKAPCTDTNSRQLATYGQLIRSAVDCSPTILLTFFFTTVTFYSAGSTYLKVESLSFYDNLRKMKNSCLLILVIT